VGQEAATSLVRRPRSILNAGENVIRGLEGTRLSVRPPTLDEEVRIRQLGQGEVVGNEGAVENAFGIGNAKGEGGGLGHIPNHSSDRASAAG